jgi:hypothetical protein
MALWSSQPLIEVSIRDFPGVKERPALKAYNFTAFCELIV